MMKKLIKKLGKSTDGKKAASVKKAAKTSAGALKNAKKSSTAKRSVLKSINSDEFYALVSKKAYEIFENRGYWHGNDQGDWYEALKNVSQNYTIK
ncbi:MAG: DUF2934 domain-containing protein [Candidatus Omnitrophota bacterium]